MLPIRSVLPTLGSAFTSLYSVTDLGAAPISLLPPTGLPLGTPPGSSGALAFRSSDPNTLLVGGPADLPNSTVSAVKVNRDSKNHITGFGTVSQLATAPGVSGGGIDAGLAPSPDDSVLFYTIYPDNQIGQIKKGSSSPSKFIDLSALGINGTGSITFVPPGFTDAGRFKITSYTDSKIYDTTITPDGSGTFNIARPSSYVSLSGGVDSITYIKGGNPGFAKDSLLVAEYNTGTLAAYDLDPVTGDPIASTRHVFLSNVGRPSAAPNNSVLSACVDPLTGDLLISTWDGQSEILKVQGFITGLNSFLNVGNILNYGLFGLTSGGTFSLTNPISTIFGSVGLVASVTQNFALNLSALATTLQSTQTMISIATTLKVITGTSLSQIQGLTVINLSATNLTGSNQWLTLNGTSNNFLRSNVIAYSYTTPSTVVLDSKDGLWYQIKAQIVLL